MASQPMVLWTAAILATWNLAPTFGQIQRETPAATTASYLGPATITRYRVGATLRARSAPVQNVRVMVALPWVCDEQQVTVVTEDFSPQVQLDERKLDGGDARQMLIYIPNMAAGEEAHALITFEVATHTLLQPESTADLRLPAKPSALLKKHLGPSSYIDVRHRKIRQAVNEALARRQSNRNKEATSAPGGAPGAESDVEESTVVVEVDDPTQEHEQEEEPTSPSAPSPDDASPDDASPGDAGDADDQSTSSTSLTDWERVEAFYDYVLENVKYEEGEDQSSVNTLTRGKGDCQAIGALFVAMCRTAKVPARLVWVHDHQYAEFYLEDAAGAGRWYPVETAGQRAFGEMPTARVILQRGDNFRVPERPRERLRYASDYALFLSTPSAKPKITYVRERL